MNYLERKKVKGFMAGTLALLTLILATFPHSLSAGRCEKALAKCAIDAGITISIGIIIGLVSGNAGAVVGALAAGGTYLSFCFAGYDFCKRYY